MTRWERKNILILVKTYPVISKKYYEVVCTAGITSEGKFIRIYPVRYRQLAEGQKYEIFRWIEADITKSRDDHRPESYKINYGTISLLHKLDPKKDLTERKKWITPLISPSLEHLYADQEKSGISLGIIKPSIITDLIIKEKTEKTWTQEELAILTQLSLVDNDKEIMLLEKIPYEFSFAFRCNNDKCNGHNLNITSWEICQTYRNFTSKYGIKGGISKIREKWLDMYNDPDTDFYFIVGTIHRFNKFIIIGHLNLKKDILDNQISLFDSIK